MTILGVMLLGLGLYLCVRPYVPSVLASYGGLWLLQWGGLMEVPTVTLSYWGVMVVIVVTINSMQQPALTKATQGLPQMLITSVAGMLLGLMMGYYASMVIGAAVGAGGGGVGAKGRKNAPYAKFQSTPSVGRATRALKVAEIPQRISIHALRGEGDLIPLWLGLNPYKFQSTPSVGRAT